LKLVNDSGSYNNVKVIKVEYPLKQGLKPGINLKLIIIIIIIEPF